MRPLFYAGILCLVFLFIIQCQILNYKHMAKKHKVLFLALLLTTLVFQIKGEVLGFALIFNSTVFLYSLSLGQKKKIRYVVVKKAKRKHRLLVRRVLKPKVDLVPSLETGVAR